MLSVRVGQVRVEPDSQPPAGTVGDLGITVERLLVPRAATNSMNSKRPPRAFTS